MQQHPRQRVDRIVAAGNDDQLRLEALQGRNHDALQGMQGVTWAGLGDEYRRVGGESLSYRWARRGKPALAGAVGRRPIAGDDAQRRYSCRRALSLRT